jgi:phage-related protein
VAAIPQIISSIVNALIGNIDKIIMAGVQLFVALIQNLPTIVVEIVKAVPQIIGGIVRAFTNSMGSIVTVGGNIVKGLWQGIQSLASWLWNKVSGWISGIWTGIKDFFGIKSPSKQMGWVGEMLVKGLAGSIQDNGDEAVKAAEMLSEDINDVMTSLASDMSTSLPTDFSVDTSVGGVISNAAISSLGGVSGSLVTVQQMIVRSEDDIRRVSQELYNLIQTGSRAQGRFSTT